MRLGLALPQFDFSLPGEQPASWEGLQAYAQRAEAVGFSARESSPLPTLRYQTAGCGSDFLLSRVASSTLASTGSKGA